jgi:hypothetical protein
MANTNPRELFRAFIDFLVLFTGISTASNLKRTQGRPLRTRGVFLFRTKKSASEPLEEPASPAS